MRKKVITLVLGTAFVGLVFANYMTHLQSDVVILNDEKKASISKKDAEKEERKELRELKKEKKVLENKDTKNEKEFSDVQEQLKEVTEDIAQREIDLGEYDYEEDIRVSLNTIEAAATDNLRIAEEVEKDKAELIKKHSQELFILKEKYESILEKKEYESLEKLLLQLQDEINDVNEKYME